eukprot:scaffold16286_cov124-Isochrysis_galbana.AAC.1
MRAFEESTERQHAPACCVCETTVGGRCVCARTRGNGKGPALSRVHGHAQAHKLVPRVSQVPHCPTPLCGAARPEPRSLAVNYHHTVLHISHNRTHSARHTVILAKARMRHAIPWPPHPRPPSSPTFFIGRRP